MIKTVIVDDERDAVESINMILTEHCPDVKVVGKAHSVSQGIEVIKDTNPDLVRNNFV